MRRISSKIIGLIIGIASALGFITLFSQRSPEELRDNLDKHIDEAMTAARRASQAKRQELEDELQSMQES